MGDWPLALDGGPIATVGTVAATSKGTVLTAAVTINVKSAWTQIVASTARDASLVVVQLTGILHNTPRSMLVDIAIGAAAAEVIVVADLIVSTNIGQNMGGIQLVLPLTIPAGTRVAARYQTAELTADAVEASLLLCSGGFAQPGALGIVTTMGAVTADSGGTNIDAGATLNTKGAWTQIVASTAREFRGLAIGIGNQDFATRSTASFLVDIAIGAAAAEQVLVSNWLLECNATTDIVAPMLSPFLPVTIPAGSRLAVRAQCNNIGVSHRNFDAVLYGIS